MTINYSPEEISEILNDYFSGITHKQYIGARYVPIFGRKGESSIDWDNSKPYEPLTIVLHEGNSFTSRQYVPTGIEINNTDYWAETGNYNAQIEQYRQEVLNLEDAVNQIPFTSNTPFDIEIGRDVPSNSVYTILKFKKRCCNLGLAYRYTDYDTMDISDYVQTLDEESYAFNGALRGPILRDNESVVETSASTNQYFYFLGFDDDGDIKYTQDFDRTLTATDLKNMGYVTAFGIWSPIILNGVPFDTSILPTDDPNVNTDGLINTAHTRAVFGSDIYGNFYAIFIEGRLSVSNGMTYPEMVNFLNGKGITTAFNMDGGGSTQLWTCGKCNMNFVFPDSSGTTQLKSSRKVVALITASRNENAETCNCSNCENCSIC